METGTQPVENVSFKERISKLGIKELRDIAQEEFGLSVDEKLKKDVVVDQLIRVYEDKVTSAKTLNEQSAALFTIADPKERLVRVKFRPLDFPNAVEEFMCDGGLGIRDPKNPKKNPNGLSKMARFKLVPNEIYNLPVRIIRHLESKTFRDSKPIYDDNTGMIVGNKPIIKPRFMLQVILSDEAMRDMGTTF